MRKGLVAVGVILIGLGLLLGFIPGSAKGSTREISCGSPWVRDHEEERTQGRIDDLSNAMVGMQVWDVDYRERCDDALGGRGVWGGVLGGLGAVILVGLALQAAKPQPVSPTQPEPADSTQE